LVYASDNLKDEHISKKKNKEAPLDPSEEVHLETNAEETNSMLIPRHQNADRS
jgi:hypothetical protein